MKKLLYFQSALPLGMAAVYGVTLWASDDPALAAGVAALAPALAAGVAALAPALAAFAPALAAFTAALALALALAALAALAEFAALAAFVALAAAFTAKENAKSTVLLLCTHNIAWAVAIGTAVYFGTSLEGAAALVAACALPLLLLRHEKRLEKRALNRESAAI